MSVEEARTISDLVSERAILSLLINNPNMAIDIFSDLEPDDFISQPHRELFVFIRNYLSTKTKISRLSAFFLISLLDKNGLLEAVGGKEYLNALEEMDVPPDAYTYYRDQLKFFSLKRKMYLVAESIKEDCLNIQEGNIDEFIGKQEQKMIDLVLTSRYRDDVVNLTNVSGFVERKKIMYQKGEIHGIPTTWPEFDSEYGGLIPKRLYVFGARSKNFKSGTLLNLAVNVAVRQNFPVLYVDLELSEEVMRSRLLSMVAEVNNDLIENGRYNKYPNLVQKVNEALEILKDKELYYVRLTSYSVEQLSYLVRKYHGKFGIKLLIFDWLKLPDGDSLRYAQERQILGVIATSLKDLAERLEIPVLCAVQLNRSAVGRDEIDETAIAESDRILWISDYLLFQRWKTEEELERDGRENGNLVMHSGDNRYGRIYKAWFDVDVDRDKTLVMREVRRIK
jgi:replicative DNA helicase